MKQPEVRIDPDRLLGDLHRLRDFGRHGTGVVRRSLTPIDLESRRWLCSRLEEAGLQARIDGVGNVLGRSAAAQALLIGSHSDTQPTGGWLDGAMGVVFGLEVARALGETDAGLAVDVASWIDEEGAFHGCLGSRSFCAGVPDGALDAADERGITLREAIDAAGLAGEPLARLEPGRHVGYLEAHIEQGPYLEEEGNRIGVVTRIVGSRNFEIAFTGRQNHAGTTPMARRRDAGRALVELASAIHAAFPDAVGERSVWTIGEIELYPGTSSIVPGRARMNLQFRDQDEAVLDRLEALARELVARADADGPVGVEMAPSGAGAVPARMDPELRRHLEQAAEQHASGRWVSMPSAAVHDAQVLASHMPSAMLFVPSIGGVSHAFDEDTAEDDLVLGCQVLATAAASILRAR